MIFFIIVCGILLDRITKLWALRRLVEGNDIVIIENLFSFQYLENRGAAFGIFQGKVSLLAIVTLCITIGMLYYLIKYTSKSKIMKISFGLIISGAIGNLYDRIAYGYVVDFILIHYKDIYYFPTFNIADMLVVFGTVLLSIYILKEDNNG